MYYLLIGVHHKDMLSLYLYQIFGSPNGEKGQIISIDSQTSLYQIQSKKFRVGYFLPVFSPSFESKKFCCVIQNCQINLGMNSGGSSCKKRED